MSQARQNIQMFDFDSHSARLNMKTPNSSHFASLQDEKEFPTEFTICSSRIGLSNWRPWFLLRNSETPSKPWFMINSCAGCWFSEKAAFGAPSFKEYKEGFLRFYDFTYWSHLCTAVDMKTGNVSIVRDGLVHFNGVMEEFKNISFKPKSLAGNVNLGLSFWKSEERVSFAKIGNLNIFASKLSIEAMKSITNGSRCGEEGDYIAWSKSKWFYTGNDIKVFEGILRR